MNSPPTAPLNRWSIAGRQLVVLLLFGGLFLSIVVLLLGQDRAREWRLRGEQATHRLDLAQQVISTEVSRVASDLLFLAKLTTVERFSLGEGGARETLEREFSDFLSQKQSYDQIRLIAPDGQEMSRVDLTHEGVKVMQPDQLQDKSSRYYFLESLKLSAGEIFVSEFDLNQEYGEIEQPLNPVIRFATPVCDAEGQPRALLVLNYLGARLLQELKTISLPGRTLLVRADGHFLLGPHPDDEWGWLLGHQRVFAQPYPTAWEHVLAGSGNCQLTPHGVFASRRVQLRPVPVDPDAQTAEDERQDLYIVSYLPPDQVFAVADQLLFRLLYFGCALVIPLVLVTRYWAVSTTRRKQQNQRIQESESRLREMSSRLLRIQEEERRAISREIHDQLGQQVTAINLDLKLAQRDTQSAAALEHLQRAIGENEELLHTLHDFAKRVRPSTLDDLGLQDAVEGYVWEFQQRTAIAVELKCQLQSAEVPSQVAENVFRLLQELLTNVVKHADAHRVEVRLIVHRPAGGPELELAVIDDGIGQLDLQADSSRLGIVGMRERVDLLQGSMDIQSHPDTGTAVTVKIPLHPPHSMPGSLLP